MLQKAIYSPPIFDVANLDEAKRIILTPEDGRMTDERWARETRIVLAADADDTLSVPISGVPDIESVTAAGAKPVVTKQGATFTYTFNALPAADWNDGLILNSIYKGNGQPKNTLTVTVKNTTVGEAAAAAQLSILVTDPQHHRQQVHRADQAILGT